MAALPADLRRRLEAAIGRESDTTGARIIAETAATAALNRLDVNRAEPRPHLDDVGRKLRVKLRARARQLGDRLRNGQQGIDRLVEACAYEHWHRMLFARFLAENDLLWHPDGYSVTLADCAEFAADEGADAYEIAGRYASRVLPQIFRRDDPLLAVRLAPEHQKALQEILKALPAEVFTASDSLGWVYQFWQARRKKQVNESEVKIGADELPAVTQLFTEPYMVDFLLQNTLGAWWVGSGRTLPVPMPYLRTQEDGSPAAGRFEGWPRTAAELKVLDPCCGSGHFLVAAFQILVAFRIAEGLSAKAACDAVLRDNLHGLELDNRCVQIAAFALAMAAWTYPGAGGYRVLPGMNVACSGLSVAPMALADETADEAAKRKEDTKKVRDRWVRAGRDVRQQRGMGRLFDLFVDAPVLGSLIDPTRDMPESLLCAPADELRPVLERVLNEEPPDVDAEEHENHVAARGIAEAARVLSTPATLCFTNVPYLGSSRQSARLRSHVESAFADAKADLASAMLQRCRMLVARGGTTAFVAPNNLTFLGAYERFRKSVITQSEINCIAKLGPRAFDTITGEVVSVFLGVVSEAAPGAEFETAGLDLVDLPGPREKAQGLRGAGLKSERQSEMAKAIGSPWAFGLSHSLAVLGNHARSFRGQCTGDAPRFELQFWEVAGVPGWVHLQGAPGTSAEYTGRSGAVLWEEGAGRLARLAKELRAIPGNSGIRPTRGHEAWGHRGVAFKQMGDLPATLYCGEIFDGSCATVIPENPAHLPAVWTYASSPEFRVNVRQINQKMNVENGFLVRVPFDLPHWQKIAAEKYPNGLPEPYSEDPTQWLFRGTITPANTPLQVAVARLLGYRWPDQPADALDTRSDDDGIVCLPPVAGEVAGSERLRDLLRAAYGSAWSAGREQTLLGSVGYANRSLDDWLRNGFFEQHCKLFHHRPFLWQVWDGHKEGFSALVNYHRLDHKLLESLAFRYLGDWITRQRDADKRGEAGAAERLRRAEDLQRRLKLILDGEKPYDIFVRWKPLAEQPVGWNPDLNDGVRLNIRPFIEADVLRWKPNIKWGKDRGKNPPGAPWGEDRDNDNHLTLAEKAAARVP